MSSSGGKTLAPLSFSFLRNRFRFKNSVVTISSFRWANQLSSRVSISNCSSSFCSGVREATHFSLLNVLDRDGATEPEPAVAGFGLGAPKNAVMLPPLGFLESGAERCSDLRLTPGLTMMSFVLFLLLFLFRFLLPARSKERSKWKWKGERVGIGHKLPQR